MEQIFQSLRNANSSISKAQNNLATQVLAPVYGETVMTAAQGPAIEPADFANSSFNINNILNSINIGNMNFENAGLLTDVASFMVDVLEMNPQLALASLEHINNSIMIAQHSNLWYAGITSSDDIIKLTLIHSTDDVLLMANSAHFSSTTTALVKNIDISAFGTALNILSLGIDTYNVIDAYSSGDNEKLAESVGGLAGNAAGIYLGGLVGGPAGALVGYVAGVAGEEIGGSLYDNWDEISGEFDEGILETRAEIYEAQAEIAATEGFLDTSGEILEAGFEIGWQVAEGVLETKNEIYQAVGEGIVNTIDHVGNDVGIVINWVNPFD